MQFSDESLDAILDQAPGVSPSAMAPFLRQALSARDKARKAAKQAGVSLSALNNLSSRSYYAVGAAWVRQGWSVHPDSWELDGLSSVAEAMVAVLDAFLPHVPMVDLSEQMNSAYVNLSRRSRAEFQVTNGTVEWAEVYVFKTPQEAEAFRVTELANRVTSRKDVSFTRT